MYFEISHVLFSENALFDKKKLIKLMASFTINTMLIRLRVGFSHLKERKFRHNFVDAINPLCSCGNFVESTTHFFLHCTHFSNQRLTFINKIKDIDKRIFDKNDSLITQTLLFGDEKLSITDNKSILEATIQFLISSARFDSPLY